MCTRVRCSKCGRPSYSGCGAHIEQVLGDVPVADRCKCRENAERERAAKKAAAGPSWWDRLTNR